jgi:hypothetical protein
MITRFKLFENINDFWKSVIYSKLNIIEENGEKWIILHHFGSHEAWKERILDPKHFGSKLSTESDTKQLGTNVIMFYTDLKDKESIFSELNYDYFKIKYPLKKLYPYDLDPLNLENKYKLENPQFPLQNSKIRKIIRGAKNENFDGMIINWFKDRFRCDIWKPIPLNEIYLIEHRNATRYGSENDEKIEEIKNINQKEKRILKILNNNKNIKLSDLSSKIGIPDMFLTKYLDSLKEKGYIDENMDLKI